MAGNNMTTPSYIEASLRSAGLLSVWHKLLAGERLDLSDGIQLFACPDVALLGWMANRAPRPC